MKPHPHRLPLEMVVVRSMFSYCMVSSAFTGRAVDVHQKQLTWEEREEGSEKEGRGKVGEEREGGRREGRREWRGKEGGEREGGRGEGRREGRGKEGGDDKEKERVTRSTVERKLRTSSPFKPPTMKGLKLSVLPSYIALTPSIGNE